jgi:hypothetical protein
VYFSPSNPAVAATFAGTAAVYFDQSNPNVKANAGTGSFTVQFDPGHELGSIKGINNSIAVHIGSTGGTMGVRVGQVDGTVAVYFSQSKPIVLADVQNTASIFSVSGSTSTAGNNTLIAPSASYNFKIFAYSFSTTAVTSLTARFTTGASAGATELWRVALQAPASISTGANFGVQPPGYFFATGTNTTLALYLDTGSLVHYSVAYIKESA